MLSALPTIAIAAWLALWLAPEPHSDWLYYWLAAGEPNSYERGGLGLWLLAIPKGLGLSPVAAALCINLLCVGVMAWLSWRSDATRYRLLWLPCALYLLLIAPYMGMVQLDLLAVSLVASGICLAHSPPSRWRAPACLGLATLLVAAGASTKPQYALVLWGLCGLLAIPLVWAGRHRERRIVVLAWVLFAGASLGFAIDSGFRSLADRSQMIRTNSAVTLYGGLLVSNDRQGCGYWSAEAASAAREDLDKPLHQAVIDRLAAKPAGHWAAIVRCKLPEILRPPPYALYWLVESPNVRAGIDNHPRRQEIDTHYHRVLHVERWAYHLLTLAILCIVAITTMLAWWRGNRLAALLPAAWIASFWGIHLVFEIQGRYFLGMYLLAPVLCMLALSNARRLTYAGDLSAKD